MPCPAICDTAWVRVLVPADIAPFITNVLTPESADGVNDVFDPVAGYLALGHQVSYARLRIYSVLGDLVWQTEGEIPTWDGKTNGKSVPHGTYYYEVR